MAPPDQSSQIARVDLVVSNMTLRVAVSLRSTHHVWILVMRLFLPTTRGYDDEQWLAAGAAT